MRLLVTGVALTVGVLAAVFWLAALSQPDEHRPTTRVQPPLRVIDSSGNRNRGVNQGAPAVGLPGHFGTAYSFHRDGSWIQVPSNPRLNPQSRDFMYSAWVNFRHRPVQRETYDIIRKGLAFTSGGEFKLEIVPPGHIKCSAKDSTGLVASVIGDEVDVADGTWHRAACARTGSTWSVVVDGAVTSKKAPLGRVGNTIALSIGSKYGREDVVPGRVDHVGLFIAAPGEAEEARRSEPETRMRDLRKHHVVGLWRLDETSQETAVGR